VTILPLSYKLGISREFFVVGGVFGLFIAMSVIDYDYKEVPDSLNLLAFYLALFSYSFFDSIVDGLIMMGAFVLLRFSVSYIIKKEAMGEADIMIAGTMGAVLGWKLSIIAFVLSAFIALPFSIYQRQRGEEELPFVPFLFAGLFVAVIFDTLLLQLWQMLYS
jgi:leader peptidase (prepilin peptidase)/N-methyltransferase